MSSNHHATLLVGALEDAEAHLLSYAAELGMELRGNPDFFAFREEVFGIEEARKLKLLASLKAVSGRKIILVSSARLTSEAQNALLKTLEDPASDARFFLVARETAFILPTLLSRMEVVRLVPETKAEKSDGESFLALSAADRLSFAREFADEEKDLPSFLDELLLVLKDREGALPAVKKVHELALAAGKAPAVSRLLLEHLALVL